MKIIYSLIVLVLLTSNNVKAQKEINLTNFNIYAKDSKLIFDWATDGKVPTNNCQIQRSPDGIAFATIAYILGPDPKQSGDQYEYKEKLKDKKLMNHYYRLIHTDINGLVMTSKIMTIAK